MPRTLHQLLFALLTVVLWLSAVDNAAAHHVLGRPAYSLNEDSNTPPAIQAEARIGDYMVTYMVFPAFPKPDQPGRINFYATRFDDGTPFLGKVAFKARAESWYSWLGIGAKAEALGTQAPDDNVYRQRYRFHH
ncbi:MAG: hypothetical protein QGF20_12090, partial [Alphaproteobacteria bacterium]|nr:hypothetical protein [Alphaproteobacteria bacterium]